VGKNYIVEGATVRCSMGGNPTKLQLPQDHKQYFMTKPLLNDLDRVAGVNVLPFGYCRIKNTCNPDLFPQWDETQSDTFIEGRPGLIEDSILGCYCGGCITITDDGQGNVSAAGNNIDWDAVFAASNGANSLSDSVYRSYFFNDDKVPQLSNSIPTGMSTLGWAGDTKISNVRNTSTEELFGESRKTNEWSNRSSKVRNGEMTKRMNGLGPYKKLSFIGKAANPATFFITVGMDVYSNYDSKTESFPDKKKLASEVTTDVALAAGTIKVCTGIGAWVGGPIGAGVGVLFGSGVNWLLDGPIICGKTPRAYLQGLTRAYIDELAEAWDRPNACGKLLLKDF
jgi:hypothetical protein